MKGAGSCPGVTGTRGAEPAAGTSAGRWTSDLAAEGEEAYSFHGPSPSVYACHQLTQMLPESPLAQCCQSRRQQKQRSLWPREQLCFPSSASEPRPLLKAGWDRARMSFQLRPESLPRQPWPAFGFPSGLRGEPSLISGQLVPQIATRSPPSSSFLPGLTPLPQSRKWNKCQQGGWPEGGGERREHKE